MPRYNYDGLVAPRLSFCKVWYHWTQFILCSEQSP